MEAESCPRSRERSLRGAGIRGVIARRAAATLGLTSVLMGAACGGSSDIDEASPDGGGEREPDSGSSARAGSDGSGDERTGTPLVP
jgi:hypothetical protein